MRPTRRGPDAAIHAWLAELASALRSALGPRLRAAFPFGSVAWGDFSPGVSDCDVMLLIDGPLPARYRDALTVAIESCRPTEAHRGLELLAVTAEAARRFGSVPAGGTGCEYSYEAFAGLGWSPEIGGPLASEPCVDLGLAVSRVRNARLLGAPAAEWIGDFEPRGLLPAAAAELRWWLVEGGLDRQPELYRNPILNACRAWRLADEGRLCSKLSGGEWALSHGLPRLAADGDDPAPPGWAELVELGLDRQRGQAPRGLRPCRETMAALLSFALARCAPEG